MEGKSINGVHSQFSVTPFGSSEVWPEAAERNPKPSQESAANTVYDKWTSLKITLISLNLGFMVTGGNVLKHFLLNYLPLGSIVPYLLSDIDEAWDISGGKY